MQSLLQLAVAFMIQLFASCIIPGVPATKLEPPRLNLQVPRTMQNRSQWSDDA